LEGRRSVVDMTQSQQIPVVKTQGWSSAARRSEYDVTNQVNTTDPAAVNDEVRRVFVELYPDTSTALMSRAFADCARLYRGGYPGYRGCDTAYHNLQHVLDVTLAMARLMDGYERGRQRLEAIGARLFGFGIVTALFHDIGYLRHRNDTRHRNGAEYTLRHVSRGARFLEQYMRDIGMPELAQVAGRVIHFTGYEIPVQRIAVPSLVFRLIGNMLGTADIVAQMADRCYLEKCRDRLYPEFVEGGLASAGAAERKPTALFISAEDLLRKTPSFYRTAITRLTDNLGAAYHYVKTPFAGHNPYLDEVAKNIRYAERVAMKGDLGLLRRVPPPRDAGATSVPVYPRVSQTTVEDRSPTAARR
jgi:hypothetical protein